MHSKLSLGLVLNGTCEGETKQQSSRLDDMEMEKKADPNSHERLGRVETPKSWSDLPLDLLGLVFNLLSFANFQRAKLVCTSWHSASRRSVPRSKQTHWLILFPEVNDESEKYCCRLFNPEEKDKLYRTRDLGLEFARSFCEATCGNWLLMRDLPHNLYIVNLFTQERINLPPKPIRWTRNDGKDYVGVISMRHPVFWIDEKTKDYVVLWGLRDLCVVYSRRRDASWIELPETPRLRNMVYKDSKLYVLSLACFVIIFDFSGEIPQKMFQRFLPVAHGIRNNPESLVVTVRGDVLMIEKGRKMGRSRHHCARRCPPINLRRTCFFRVVKVCSSGFQKDPEKIRSLGDESMLFDQGITVPADDTDGFIRNSTYYSDSSISEENAKEIYLFNLETRKTELVHKFVCSSVQFSKARWFVPSFTQT